jgi:hypothetical protein
MEEELEQKVGAGIWTIAIIQFIIEAILLLSCTFDLFNQDKVNSILKQRGIPAVPSSAYVIGIVFCVLIIVSLILILLRNTIGIFGYFIICIGNFIYSIVKNGFSPFLLLSIILPVLMAIFVYQKRTIFKISRGEEE